MTDFAQVNPDGLSAVSTNALLTALENSSIHYFRYFPQDKVILVPERTRAVWGSGAKYVDDPYDTFVRFVAEEDRETFMGLYRSIDQGAPTASASFRMMDMQTWGRVTFTTVSWTADGKPQESVAIIEDLSKAKAAQKKADERNENLSFMTQVFQVAAIATDASVFIFDTKRQSIVVPDSTAEQWGVSVEQMGVPYETAEGGTVLPESKEEYIRLHEAMMNGADEAAGNVMLRTAGGQVGYYSLTFRALHDAEGNPTGKAVGVYRDVTEQHEDRMRQIAMTKALTEGINAAYYVDLDNDSFILQEISHYMSGTIRTFVEGNSIRGGRYTDVARLYCEHLVCDEDRERMKRAMEIENVLARLAKQRSYYVQYRIQPNPEGQEYFEMHVSATDFEEGNKAFVSFRCIDEQKAKEIEQQNALKQAFEAAQRASNAKTDFFSRMSHDIRTPMNAIIGMTAIAGTHIDDRERVKDCLAKITVSSRHLLGLINEVLDMSKIESGKLDLSFSEFDLSKLVENLVVMCRPQLEEMNHDLLVNVHDIEHELVIGDSQRIQQVFMNLMSNAVKYTPRGGVIRLSITEKPTRTARTGCYEFVFEDNGIGMDQEFLAHLFEPFARADDERAAIQQGTGLGMTIARSIVQMMNGDIEVESQLNVGTKVTVTIFLELQSGDAVSEEDMFVGLPVLIVDDDKVTCEAACDMMDELGMNGEWVLMGREAVKRVEERHASGRDYFAVIADWKMPQMDGVATTRAIRQAVGDDVPIVIISAYDWSEIEDEAREAGANAFISKPLFKSKVTHLFKTLLREGKEEKEDYDQTLDSIAHKDFSGKRVLLVEDNLLNREIAVVILKMANLEVDTAINGKEAVDIMAACEDGYYDMVFMDIQMPVMNGYESTRGIRALDREYTKQVPIVAMTADAFAQDVAASRAAGMNEHLAKPIEFDKLYDVLDRWLG